MEKNQGIEQNLNVHGAGESSSNAMRELRDICRDEETSDADGNKKQKKQPTATKAIKILNSLGKGQDQESGSGSQVKEASINDLPVEMLTEILKNVETQSLFACRLVNLQWSEISTQILPTRSDAVLSFYYEEDGDNALSNSPETKREEENSLWDFVESMKSSKSCPYARFRFNAYDPESFFSDQGWRGLMSYFDPSNQNQNPNPNQNQNQRTKIKYLDLNVYTTFDDLPSFTCKLRDLLLNEVPGLEEFGLGMGDYDDVENIKLFPPSKGKNKKKHPKFPATTTNPTPALVELPHLKVLHFADCLCKVFPLIVQDLLNAAVNLKSIRVTGGFYHFNTFQLLHSLGKLHLLQNAKMTVDQSFLAEVKRLRKPSEFPSAFKLHVVDWLEPTCRAHATNFVSLLLESSKNSLRNLELEPLGFLGGLQFPKFTKLRKLELHQLDGPGESYFPPETRSKDIFPAVSDLDFLGVDFPTAFPREDSIPRLPNVKTLCLSDHMVSENVISVLALMCPNLIKLQIQKYKYGDKVPALNLLKIGRSIWTHMTHLESLQVDLDLDSQENNPHALDSCFTGFGMENCQRLFEIMEAKKTFEKWRFEINVPELESKTVAELMGEREHSSILDMKDLRKLTVNPYSGTKLLDKKDFFANKLTWISHDFAFKLMPKLKLNED